MRVLRSAVVLCGPSLALQQQAFAQTYTCDNTGILGPLMNTFDDDGTATQRVDKGRCLRAGVSANEVCTSNSVELGTVTNIELIAACTAPSPSSTGEVKFFADVNFIGTTNEAFDVGLHFGPTSTGLCYNIGLTCDGNADFELDGDVCDDIKQGPSTFVRVELTAPCDGVGGDLEIPYCTSWQTNQNTGCSGIMDIGPDQNSKCNCPVGSPLVVEQQCLEPYTVSHVCDMDGFTTTLTITGPASGFSYDIVRDGEEPVFMSALSASFDYSEVLESGVSYTFVVEGCGDVVTDIMTTCTNVFLCQEDIDCTFPLEKCCKEDNICVSELDFDVAACGDPHMTGFLGQKFDFTGEDGGWYCLIKDDNMQVNMRVTNPVPSVPEITYITGLSVLTTGTDGSEHDLVIEVKDPHSLDSSCPSAGSPCLADGALSVTVDGEETLLAPGTVSLGGDVEVSAANLPGACRTFGFEKYWEHKKLEYASATGRRLSEKLTMAEWILADPTATNMAECMEYVARAETQEEGVFGHQSEHASFQIMTPTATIRLSHGKLHQVAMRDPTDQFDLPDHLTWQMNMAVDHAEVSHDAKGVLGETHVPTRDVNGAAIMTGMEAIRGTQDDYRVDGALGRHFVQDAHTS